LVDDLALRSRPLRELWEAYGPGLLHSVARQTEEDVLVSRADVILVHPVLGGAGKAHLSNNSVRLEAVLTNNVPQLPETVRLAWLLGQLNLDLPKFSERVPADRLPYVAALAVLPVVLQAGHELELCQFNPTLTTLAIARWKLATSPEATAELVHLWWETYQSSPTSWSTALSALDQMLPADGTK
jgi:hypothetical protein